MKKAISSVAILCLSLAAAIACDQAPNRSAGQNGDLNKQNEKPVGSVKSYRFTSAVDSCDTYKRSFETQIELCYAIQVPELNNDNCAEAERLAFFQQNCAPLNIALNPEKARQKILNVDGYFVDCTLTETGFDQVRQFTANDQLIMEHTSTRAVINHTGALGKISLRLSLRDIESNREIARIQKTWQDEVEPLTLSAPTEMGSPVLTCLVSLAQDPDRE